MSFGIEKIYIYLYHKTAFYNSQITVITIKFKYSKMASTSVLITDDINYEMYNY